MLLWSRKEQNGIEQNEVELEVEWNRMEQNGIEQSGASDVRVEVEWSGIEWNGIEQNRVEQIEHSGVYGEVL